MIQLDVLAEKCQKTHWKAKKTYQILNLMRIKLDYHLIVELCLSHRHLQNAIQEKKPSFSMKKAKKKLDLSVKAKSLD